jgi:ribosomal RNA small subunit methyltransferase RsmB
MDINRKTAFNTLMRIEKDGAYSNLELNSQINRDRPDSPALVREMVYGVLENKMYLDYLLSQMVSKGLKSVKLPTLVIMRMGLYQMIFMTSVPEYAAVNESVKLARKFCHGQDGFVNGVLRNYSRKKDQLDQPDVEKDPLARLSNKYSYDKWIVKLWMGQYGEEAAEKMLAAGNLTRPLTVRVNLMKNDRERLADSLTKEGYTVDQTSYSQRMLRIKGSGILETKEYLDGMFSVQDEGSILSIETLAPQSGETIYDVCAAPGGKSLAAAEIMENSGTITSFDFYGNKLEPLKREMKRLGISIIETKVSDATQLNEELIETADRVICDVPCTGLGVLGKKPEIKYRKIDDDGRSLAKKQLKILENSAEYVKRGGFIIYSTCTVNKIENEQVVKSFLGTHQNFESIEEKQLIPDAEGTDGFYFCKMRKL